MTRDEEEELLATLGFLPEERAIIFQLAEEQEVAVRHVIGDAAREALGLPPSN